MDAVRLAVRADESALSQIGEQVESHHLLLTLELFLGRVGERLRLIAGSPVLHTLELGPKVLARRNFRAFKNVLTVTPD